MIDLKLIKYRLIGIAEMDNNTSEDSVIDIIKKWNEHGGPIQYGYKVVTGMVNGMGPGREGHFSTGCRLHAYCVPVGMGIGLLPDLKEGDYVINRTRGSRAWRYTRDFDGWGASSDMSNMRYATYEEVNAVKAAISSFKEGDIVVSKGGTGQLRSGTIIRVRRIDMGCVHSNDFREEWNNYAQEKFRHATLLEIDAYKNGFHSLPDWKNKLEREAMNRFPSPASFTDVFGRKYTGISYEYPEWEDEKLVLCPGYGIVYYSGQWATPFPQHDNLHRLSKRYAENSTFGLFTPKSLIGLQSLENEIQKIEKLTGARAIMERKEHSNPPKITGRKFNEEDYLSNPMNQRMSIPVKKTRKQSVHKRIIF